jgi:SAM-dependent methyltransferase
MNRIPTFDQYAESYDDDLSHALTVTGSDKDYFAQRRVAWLAQCLAVLGEQPQRAMDYGCGTGSTTPLLLSALRLKAAFGVDVSSQIVAKAREKFGADNVQFMTVGEPEPFGKLDLAYCNGVFHHIAPAERPAAVEYIANSLRTGGVFCVWENNPWNPATRYVMSRCAFDQEAQMLSVRSMRKLLKRSGFTILRNDFLFIFPAFLKALKTLEPWLCKLPVGAQYQVLAQKDAIRS